MKKLSLLLMVLLMASSYHVQAQQGGVLPLPEGVQSVTSYDPQNSLIVAYTGQDGRLHYEVIPLKHVYSGGIAMIFGGNVIPTQAVVTPLLGNRAAFPMTTNAPFFYTPRPGGTLGGGSFGGGMPTIPYPTGPVQVLPQSPAPYDLRR